MKIHLNLINIIFILIGTFIFSFGIVNFNMTNELTEGGFTGIALILYHLFGTSPALMNLIFNIPLFFVGYKLLGKLSFLYTLTGTLSVSLFLWLCERYPMHIDLKEDLLLASLFGGVFIGRDLV